MNFYLMLKELKKIRNKSCTEIFINYLYKALSIVKILLKNEQIWYTIDRKK